MLLLRFLQFIALVLTALALVPAGAHLFELPNKIGLPREQYFVVQQIYRGWALLGVVLIAAFLANLAAAALLFRRGGRRAWLSLGAGLLMALALANFFVWVFPANLATANWTVVPSNWQQLRVQWELGHAGGAVVTFAALCLATLSLRGVDDQRPG
jgi:hypothetical protein